MSQGTGIESNSEDINFSNRDILGFNFEVRIDNILKNMEINYISNPLQNMALWKRHQGIGSDFKIPSWNWEIEAKYSNAKIFPSWIDRDWIPRFKNGSFRVTVHNRGMKLSTNSLERCFIHDIYLVEIGYLRYVLKGKIKHKSRGNKVLEPTSRNKEYGSLESRSGGFNSEGLNVESPKLSSTLKNKIRWEIRKISNFITETLSIFEPFLRVLSKLWNDKHGSLSLTNWIPMRSETKLKPKKRNKNKLFQCPFRIVLTCPYNRPFYACLLLIIYNYTLRLIRCGYNDEDKVVNTINDYLFNETWQHNNQLFARCRCKPISFIENEIVDRQPRSPFSSFEPCKNYKCSLLIRGRCPYLLALEKTKIKPIQFKILKYLEA